MGLLHQTYQTGENVPKWIFVLRIVVGLSLILKAYSFFNNPAILQNAFAGSTTGFGPDNVPSGLSIFTSGKMYKELIKFYARYDFYNPNSKNSSTGFNQNFVTAGLDFIVHPKVHIMPNIWLNAYSGKSDQYKNPTNPTELTQVVPRITFFYDYR